MTALFPALHRALGIPEGYYRTDGQQPPAVSAWMREQALTALRSNKRVIKGTTADDLLEALVRRFSRWIVEPTKPPLPKGTKRKPDSDRKREAMAFMVANPDAKVVDLADRFDVAVKTVQNYRYQLRKEGRI